MPLRTISRWIAQNLRSPASDHSSLGCQTVHWNLVTLAQMAVAFGAIERPSVFQSCREQCVRGVRLEFLALATCLVMSVDFWC